LALLNDLAAVQIQHRPLYVGQPLIHLCAHPGMQPPPRFGSSSRAAAAIEQQSKAKPLVAAGSSRARTVSALISSSVRPVADASFLPSSLPSVPGSVSFQTRKLSDSALTVADLILASL
jgi:hypothetical protein